MPSLPAAPSSSGREVGALENEVELLRAELTDTQRRLESDVARAREDALGVMRATGMVLWSEALCQELAKVAEQQVLMFAVCVDYFARFGGFELWWTEKGKGIVCGWHDRGEIFQMQRHFPSKFACVIASLQLVLTTAP